MRFDVKSVMIAAGGQKVSGWQVYEHALSPTHLSRSSRGLLSTSL